MEQEPQYIKNLYSIIGNMPLFFINKDEDIKARAILQKELNKDIQQWVCIHYRNSSYTNNFQKGLKIPKDDFGQDFRNTTPDLLIPSIQRLNGLGIHVFLMGHQAIFPIKDSDLFTNFSNCRWRTDFLDVYLSARCLFYFGNSSGSAQISRMFGRPTIGSNLSLIHCFNGTNTDITSPKKYYDNGLERYLTLSEILKSPIKDARNADEYQKNGISLHENTAEELLLILEEMLENLGIIKTDVNFTSYDFKMKYLEILKTNNIIISSNNSNISLKYLFKNQEFIK